MYSDSVVLVPFPLPYRPVPLFGSPISQKPFDRILKRMFNLKEKYSLY